MHRLPARLVLIFSIIGFLTFSGTIEAGSLGSFLRAFGYSNGHRHHRSHFRNRERQQIYDQPETNGGEGHPVSAAVTPPPAPSGAPSSVRVESDKRTTSVARDANHNFPVGIPVPNKEGIVKSPYAPNRGFVDVRGFPSGTEVKDPYTGKVFLTPP